VVITGLLVLLLGGVGAVARFVTDALVERRRLGQFPLGTLAVNASGCFVLGLLVGLGASHGLRLLLGTAAIGSYTTFSTWMLETHRPLEDGDARLAWLNVAIGLVVGFGAVALGQALGAAW
jgi:CrcB protein